MVDNVNQCSALLTLRDAFLGLPKAHSPEWRAIVADVAEAMHLTNGLGFTLVDLRPFLLQASVDEFYRQIPVSSQFNFGKEEFLLKGQVLFAE